MKALLAFVFTASLFAVQPASAITINFDFTAVFDGALANGTTASGNFDFDPSVIPFGGTGLVTDFAGGLPLNSASFTWAGATFDASNTKLSMLEFESGVVTNLAYQATTYPNIYFSIYTFIPGGGGGFKNQPFGGYSIPGPCFPTCVGRADVSFGPAGVVDIEPYVSKIPEPGSLALLAMAGTVAWLRRRPAPRSKTFR